MPPPEVVHTQKGVALRDSCSCSSHTHGPVRRPRIELLVRLSGEQGTIPGETRTTAFSALVARLAISSWLFRAGSPRECAPGKSLALTHKILSGGSFLDGSSKHSAHHAADQAAGTATVAVMASAAPAATTGHVVGFVADAGLRR
jgi:hypothetical protein